jgi:phytoene desaturase
MPKNTPALYSLMNYADNKLGTWYPMGGMFEIIKAFEKIATSFGVEINTNQAIDGFAIKSNRITGISTTKGDVQVDGIVASADYNHIEQEILKPEHRQYSPAYWDTRKMSPSSILFYLGVNKPIPELQHHNLFFDTSFDAHAKAIYEDPAWPEKPLFYVCNPSKTDPGVAPKGEENLFILVPVASGLADNEEIIEEYYQMIMGRLEKRLKMNIADSVVYKKSYALSDFKKDYHAFKGNAYGLANTLRQTAVLKPSMHNKKVRNLIYSGQLTVPGPGVPPSIISGQVAADELIKTL